MRKGHIIGLVILLLFGALKMNFEQRLAEEHRAAFFHGAKLNLSLRQQIGQGAYLAALGGFRAPVADYFWLQAHVYWAKTEWVHMTLLFQNVVTLQPRNTMFWDVAAWHLAYNAALAQRENKNEPREAIRIQAQNHYFRLAEDFLLRGIQNNPDSYELYQSLAKLYEDKQVYPDKVTNDEKAYEYFDKAAKFPNAPVFEKRFALYHLAKIPGREREAYDRMLALYKSGPNERLPTLLKQLKILEEKLNIPDSERIPDKVE